VEVASSNFLPEEIFSMLVTQFGLGLSVSERPNGSIYETLTNFESSLFPINHIARCGPLQPASRLKSTSLRAARSCGSTLLRFGLDALAIGFAWLRGLAGRYLVHLMLLIRAKQPDSGRWRGGRVYQASKGQSELT
jgi:hypothetical protein